MVSPSIVAHSLQANRPLACSARVMAKAWACHGSRNTGPCASAGRPGLASSARLAATGSIASMSRRFQIGLERLDRDLQRRVGIGAPQVTPVEADRVEPLR